jgi:hypothetical protein
MLAIFRNFPEVPTLRKSLTNGQRPGTRSRPQLLGRTLVSRRPDVLFVGAGGGNRTHTPRRERDFESRASASFTTPARKEPSVYRAALATWTNRSHFISDDDSRRSGGGRKGSMDIEHAPAALQSAWPGWNARPGRTSHRREEGGRYGFRLNTSGSDSGPCVHVPAISSPLTSPSKPPLTMVMTSFSRDPSSVILDTGISKLF